MNTDWQNEIGEYIKGKSLIEFGIGKGTEYLIELCSEVKSVEIAEDKKWYDEFQFESENWRGLFLKHEDRWSEELGDMIKKEAKGFDVAFVDPGIHCRAKMVNSLFGLVDTIFAHDTNMKGYGWENIEDDERYKKTELESNQGTTLWEIK